MTEERHCITINPDLCSGQPTVDHQGITAELVARVWWAGSMSLSEIEENWPGLNRGAVLVACWYQARYGGRTWRKRWQDWLKVANGELWHGNYASCPMPNQRGKEVPR